MLLTLKPVIYAANVADSDLATGNKMSEALFAYAEEHGSKAVIVSAQVCMFNDEFDFAVVFYYIVSYSAFIDSILI